MNTRQAIERGMRICRDIGIPDPGVAEGVEVAVLNAARTEARLPDRSRRYLNGYRRTDWPDNGSKQNQVAVLDDRMIGISPGAISNAELVPTWLHHVRWGHRQKRDMSIEERQRRAVKVVWLRGEGMSFAAIGRRFGIHRSTALRIYRQAILDIVDGVSPTDAADRHPKLSPERTTAPQR